MFDHCKTLDELAKEGPIERKDLDPALAQLGRGDMTAARVLAEERMFVGSVDVAIRRARKRLT